MSKKLERLLSELLSEGKITNLLGFLTEQNPGGWSIYRVKNPSPQIRILVTRVKVSHIFYDATNLKRKLMWDDLFWLFFLLTQRTI